MKPIDDGYHNPPKNYPNLTKAGRGKPKGCLTYTTRERLNQARAEWDQLNVKGKTIALLMERVEEGSIKSADAINLLKFIAEYSFKRVDDEIIDSILPNSPEAAEKEADKIIELLDILKAIKNK
ncbi:hypothetical protein VAA96_004550 [Salmonella enterica]|nr:hypothetical protein [Salmonella enterica]